MRISKKFAGRCIGKLVFTRKPGLLTDNVSSPQSVAHNGSAKLSHLEESYKLSCNIDDDSNESLNHYNGGRLHKNPIYSPIRSNGGLNNRNNYLHGHNINVNHQNSNVNFHHNNLHYSFGAPSIGGNNTRGGVNSSSNSSSDAEGSSSSDDDASRYYMNALNRGHGPHNSNHHHNGWQDESMINPYCNDDPSTANGLNMIMNMNSSHQYASTHDLTNLLRSTFDNEHSSVVDLGLPLNAGDSQIPLEPEEWRDVLSFFCADSGTTNLVSGGIPHNIFNATKVNNLVHDNSNITSNNDNNSNNNSNYIDTSSPPGASGGGSLLPFSSTKQHLLLQNQLDKTKNILFMNNIGSTNSNMGMGFMKPTSVANSHHFTSNNGNNSSNSSTSYNYDSRLYLNSNNNNSSSTPILTNSDMHKAASLLKTKLLNSYNNNSNINNSGISNLQSLSQSESGGKANCNDRSNSKSNTPSPDNGNSMSSNSHGYHVGYNAPSSIDANAIFSTNEFTPQRDRAVSNLSLGLISGAAFADILGVNMTNEMKPTSNDSPGDDMDINDEVNINVVTDSSSSNIQSLNTSNEIARNTTTNAGTIDNLTDSAPQKQELRRNGSSFSLFFN